jgi:hypothetical protein
MGKIQKRPREVVSYLEDFAFELQALELFLQKTLSRGAVPVFVLSHSKLSSIHAVLRAPLLGVINLPVIIP